MKLSVTFKIVKIHILFWIIHLIPTLVSFAQTTSSATDSLATQIHQFSNLQRADLVYLQTNKGIYETEEDVWFKGYVLDAKYFTPSKKSKTLFVQLIEDQKNKIVWEEKYEIENGFVDGHLFLQDTLKPGNYTLAAYSSQSFFKEQKEFYALRKIKVLQSIQQNTILKKVKDSALHFSLFPEGGYLVSEIQSRLAFKSVNSNGLPMDVSGTLYENDSALVTFKSSHAGMGSILFTPKQDKEYHIKLLETSDKLYELPKIQANGKTLQLIRVTKDEAYFKISQTSNQLETIYLRVQIRGVVYSIAETTIDKERIVKIPLKEIPQGIAEITLFNETLEPVAERLVYFNPEKQLHIKTVLHRSEYTTREKAVLKIQVTDQNNKPVQAHLGLSIYDRLYDNPTDSKNIQSHFYLSTQLKGTIYDSGYYFNKKNKDRLAALNILLLTQGWRAYNWAAYNLKEQNSVNNFVINDQIKGLIFTNKKTKEPPTSKIVMAFTSDDNGKKDFIEAGASGFFNITSEHLKMGSGGYLYFKPMTPEKPKYRINLLNTSFKKINEYRKSETEIYPLAKQLKNTENKKVQAFAITEQINQLDDVTIHAKKKRVFRDKYLGKLDSLAKLKTFDFVCEHNFFNCTSCGIGTVPIEGNIYMVWIGKGLHHHGQGRRPFMGKEIEHKEYHFTELTEAELLRRFNLAMLKGYYGKKEFYQPTYDSISVKDPFPDFRNTLFWKPNIITDTNGEATVEFFCSDLNTMFLGNIEGVSGEGVLGVEKFEFAVRKLEE